MNKILCIEDAADMRLIIKSALKGHDLRMANNWREAQPHLAMADLDLILLDVELPDGDGLELLSQFQMQHPREVAVPLIVLTGARGLTTKTTAFSLGAEDYIEKPFDPDELKLRVDTRIRKARLARVKNETKQIGDLVLSVSEQKLVTPANGEAIDLTSLEFRIFALLARAPEQIYSRETLITQVWGANIAITERTVDTHIAHLRKKLTKSQVKIETVFGSGYKLKIAA